MTDDKRLKYLIQYHHSLSIQYASFKTHTQSTIDQLKQIEKEIEQILFNK